MIELRARADLVRLSKRLDRTVFRLENHDAVAGHFRLVPADAVKVCDSPLLALQPDTADVPGDLVVAPSSMSYLKAGDIISLSRDGLVIDALWRGNGTTNTLLLTERCDNYCLMCSQPPRDKIDDWLLEQAFDVISLMPKDATEIGVSGGEPTIYGRRFIDLVAHVRTVLPDTALHILSNGRRFADFQFAEAYAENASEYTMVGIPLYGSESSLHDYVVQADGAFEETLGGILNLGELGQAIELRVVLHAVTAPHIVSIAEYIARNLPFVDQVALMGLEMMGLARRNLNRLWIEPSEYMDELAEATELLHAHGIRTFIYNHQLCTLHRDIWDFAVKSISDWKNEYDPVCSDCDLLESCGGFFHSAKYGSSNSIFPMTVEGIPKSGVRLDRPVGTISGSWTRRRIPIMPVEEFEMSDE